MGHGRGVKMADTDLLDYTNLHTIYYPHTRGPTKLHVVLNRPHVGCHPEAIGLHLHIDVIHDEPVYRPFGFICLGLHAAQKLSEQLSQEIDKLLVDLVIETLTA
jgi:hypothetical protein